MARERIALFQSVINCNVAATGQDTLELLCFYGGYRFGEGQLSLILLICSVLHGLNVCFVNKEKSGLRTDPFM